MGGLRRIRTAIESAQECPAPVSGVHAATAVRASTGASVTPGRPASTPTITARGVVMTQSLTFETLYGRYQPLVRRRLQALLTRYPSEVEDAVQETFVKAWRALDRVDPDSNVQAWMMRIATNTALDLVRSPRF